MSTVSTEGAISTVSTVSTGPVAAPTMGAGALGFVLVLLLIVAVAGLMWAMAGSLRRMRKRVSSGEFGQDAAREGGHPSGHDAERRGRDTRGAPGG